MAHKFSIIGCTISWWCVFVLAAIVIWAGLVCNTNASRLKGFHKFEAPNNTSYGVSLSKDFTRKYEYHEVQEGETLYSIMEKYGDPDLLENNPHIVDVDDIIPGLLIQGVLALGGMRIPVTPNEEVRHDILFCSCDDNSVHLYDLPSFEKKGSVFVRQEARSIHVQDGNEGLFFIGDGTGLITVGKMAS